MPEEYHVELADENGPIHRYTFIGGPIEAPQENQEIFFWIGLASTSWARMEQHIDAIIMQVNKPSNNHDLFDPDHPKPFGDKIKRLKRLFAHHPDLLEYSPTVDDFSRGLLELAEERNALLHGVLEDFNKANDTFTLNGCRYRKRENDFHHRHQVIPVQRLRELCRLTNIAHYGLCEISKELFTPEFGAKLQRPQ